MIDNGNILVEIDALLSGHFPIPKFKLLKWAESTNVDVLGAVLHVLMEASNRLDPPLNMKEYGDTALATSLSIIASGNKEDSDYKYTDYEAAEVIRWWTVECYNQRSVQEEALARLNDVQEALAEFYQRATEDARRCIVDGALEHIFEVGELQKFFESWKDRPGLGQAYREAKEWADWKMRQA